MARADVAAAGALLAFAAFAVVEASRLPLGAVRNPGPGFFPWWLGATLGLLAAGLVGQALRARPRPGTADAGGAGRRIGRVATLLVVLAGYVGLVEPLGYPVCTFLLVVFMLRVVERQRWPIALGLAIASAIGSYLLFAIWLKVPLPSGALLR